MNFVCHYFDVAGFQTFSCIGTEVMGDCRYCMQSCRSAALVKIKALSRFYNTLKKKWLLHIHCYLVACIKYNCFVLEGNKAFTEFRCFVSSLACE